MRIEALLALASAGAPVQTRDAPPIMPLPETGAAVLAVGEVPEVGLASPSQRVEEVEAARLPVETSPSALAHLWEGTTGGLRLRFVRYDQGLRQSLRCRFHALQAAFRRLRASVREWKERQRWIAPRKPLFQIPAKRTVRRRMAKLQARAQDSPAEGVLARLAAKLPRLLPAVGSSFRPSTSNAAERFRGAFERFARAKGPFQSRASAEKHLALFLLGYVFETYSAEVCSAHQGRCPLQLAGYQVASIPWKAPPLCRSRRSGYKCISWWMRAPDPLLHAGFGDRSMRVGPCTMEGVACPMMR